MLAQGDSNWPLLGEPVIDSSSNMWFNDRWFAGIHCLLSIHTRLYNCCGKGAAIGMIAQGSSVAQMV